VAANRGRALINGAITYELDGHQYLVMGAGDKMFAFVVNQLGGQEFLTGLSRGLLVIPAKIDMLTYMLLFNRARRSGIHRRSRV